MQYSVDIYKYVFFNETMIKEAVQCNSFFVFWLERV